MWSSETSRLRASSSTYPVLWYSYTNSYTHSGAGHAYTYSNAVTHTHTDDDIYTCAWCYQDADTDEHT